MKNIFIAFLLSVSTSSFAYEVVDVCATYVNTGKKYKVEAKVFSGSELNSKTNSYEYSAFSKYAIIFWAQGQATVIKMDYSYGISTFGSSGKDKSGYPWSLSTSTSFCY